MRTLLKHLFVLGASCALLVLSGCAAQSAKPNFVEVARATETEAVTRVIYDPSAWIGVIETPAIRDGNFVAVETVLPYDLKEEFQLPRIRWIGYTTDDVGTIYPIQFVWTGCSSQFGKLRMLAIVEGTTSLKGLRGVHLSTLLSEAYGLDGRPVAGFDAEKFQADVAYQHEFIRANGTALDSLSQVRRESVQKMLSTFWRAGDMLIPPSTDKEIVWHIVARNPAERLEQKYVTAAAMSISTSMTGTAIGTVFDGIRTLMTPCFGWHKECRVTDEHYFAATQQCIARTTGRSQR